MAHEIIDGHAIPPVTNQFVGNPRLMIIRVLIRLSKISGSIGKMALLCQVNWDMAYILDGAFSLEYTRYLIKTKFASFSLRP
jgi:hypothetical protein